MRYLVLFLFLLGGCVSNNSFVREDSEYKYEKKKDYFAQSYSPQYHSLKNTISKQEYRMLPSYLQECYERSDW